MRFDTDGCLASTELKIVFPSSFAPEPTDAKNQRGYPDVS
jgi:hypothetical protein